MAEDELVRWARTGGYEAEHLAALGEAVGRALAESDEGARGVLEAALREASRKVRRDPVRLATVTALTGVLLAAEGSLRRAVELTKAKSLSPSYCTLLRALAEGSKTPAQLAARLGRNKAQLSRELGQLVEMKLVDRYIHQDKRTYFCALSPRGRQVLPLLPRDVSAAAPVCSQGRVAMRDAATLDGPAAAL